MLKNKNYELITTLGLPCIVEEIWFPENEDELENCIEKNKNVPIIADGTNIVCKPHIKKLICLRKMPSEIWQQINGRHRYVWCTANYKAHKLVQYSIDNKFSGLEGLWGLPGTVGGAVYGNSGSGQASISDHLLSVITLDRNGVYHLCRKKDLDFDRRYCNLQKSDEIIVRVLFSFLDKPVDKKYLEETKIHRMKIPYRSAGGIYKNWHALKPYSDQLIGLQVGGAKISEMVNVIINDETATYEDVIGLIEKTKQIVKEPLQLEVKIL